MYATNILEVLTYNHIFCFFPYSQSPNEYKRRVKKQVETIMKDYCVNRLL